MKRTLLLINLLLLSVCVFPQENIEVNYATIKKYVENQSDDYLQLIERFEANDSLLSLNDYALIYYGHSFTPKYKGSMELWKELETLMEEKKWEEAYTLLKECRKKNPVSLKLLIYAVNLASELRREEEVQAYIDK